MALRVGPDREGIRLLIVDDHRVFAEALASRLSTDARVDRVDVAFSVGMAQAFIRQSKPSVVLVDLRLDGESGVDLLSALSASDHPPASLAVSGLLEIDIILEALEAGALGWVPKDGSVDLLLLAVEQVSRGRGFLPETLLLPVLRRLMHDRSAPDAEQTFIDELSPRELQVLRCLVSGMTRNEVAVHLFLSTNTVRTHVQSVLRQAEVHSTLAVVALARELGLTGIEHNHVVAPRTRHRHQHSWSE